MALPHIILFADVNCMDQHTHVCEAQSYVGDAMNDKTSSFIILEGNWAFFANAGFNGPMGGGKVLGPGVYNWIEDGTALGVSSNDILSSLRPM